MENQISNSPILTLAWTKFSELDATSRYRELSNQRLRRWIVLAGVAATILALFFGSFQTTTGIIGVSSKVFPVLIPLIGAGLATFTKIFYSSGDWKVTRSCAEELLKEIYFYRTILQDMPNRREWLAKRIEEIQRQLHISLGGDIPLKIYTGPLPPHYDPKNPASDPGFKDLTGDEYFKYRLENQLSMYRMSINKYQTERVRLQILVVLACILIVFLLVIGGVFSLWVELLASMTGALLTWQEVRNIDPIIKSQNKITLELTKLYDRWTILEGEERTTNEFFRMVRNCEDILWYEHIEYIKSMQEALQDSTLENESELISQVLVEQKKAANSAKLALMDAVIDSTDAQFDVTSPEDGSAKTFTDPFQQEMDAMKVSTAKANASDGLTFSPTEELTLRSQPIIAPETVIRTVSPNEVLICVDPISEARAKVGVTNQWIKVRDASDKEGYVAAWYLKIRSAPPLKVKVILEGAAFRSEARVGEGTLIRRLPLGSELNAIDPDVEYKLKEKNAWLKVQDNEGTDGYIVSGFVNQQDE